MMMSLPISTRSSSEPTSSTSFSRTPGSSDLRGGRSEPSPILTRRNPESGHEPAAHRLWTTEADKPCGLGHPVTGLQEHLSMVQTCVLNKPGRRCLELSRKQAGEVTWTESPIPSQRTCAVLQRRL